MVFCIILTFFLALVYTEWLWTLSSIEIFVVLVLFFFFFFFLKILFIPSKGQLWLNSLETFLAGEALWFLRTIFPSTKGWLLSSAKTLHHTQDKANPLILRQGYRRLFLFLKLVFWFHSNGQFYFTGDTGRWVLWPTQIPANLTIKPEKCKINNNQTCPWDWLFIFWKEMEPKKKKKPKRILIVELLGGNVAAPESS